MLYKIFFFIRNIRITMSKGLTLKGLTGALAPVELDLGGYSEVAAHMPKK